MRHFFCFVTAMAILFYNKKQQDDKPGSVLSREKVSVIYLAFALPQRMSGLPPGMGRAALITPVYITLQPIRRTALCVATKTGKLLPHLFTLTAETAVIFLRCSCPRGQLPVKKYGALSRTFLSRCRERQTVLLLKGKGRTFHSFCQYLFVKYPTKKRCSLPNCPFTGQQSATDDKMTSFPNASSVKGC